MKASALPFASFLSFFKPADASLKSAARLASRVCRMVVVSRGPVYCDLFEEFADLATKGMCPLGAPDEWGPRKTGRSYSFRGLPPGNLLGCLLSASYDLEDVRDLPEGGA